LADGNDEFLAQPAPVFDRRTGHILFYAGRVCLVAQGALQSHLGSDDCAHAWSAIDGQSSTDGHYAVLHIAQTQPSVCLGEIKTYPIVRERQRGFG
jgi:hypothetical protein